MLQKNYIVFIFLILIRWEHCCLASLPQWVHRVESCPDPNNISQWIAASKRLNCYHHLTSTDPLEQAAVYHCLPSSFLNETVAYCGKSVPIAPGNCPVYNYKYGQNVAASYYNCSAFTSGCPKVMFHSKNVHQHPECLRINRKEKCFEAKTNCTIIFTTATLETVTEIVEQTNMSEREDIITVACIASAVALILVVAGGFVLYKKKRLWKYLLYQAPNNSSEDNLKSVNIYVPPNFISEQELENLKNEGENQRQSGNSDCGSDDSGSLENQAQNEKSISGSNDSGFGQDGKQVEERQALLDKMCEGATIWSYNELLENLKESMTLDVFENIKRRLFDRRENKKNDLDEIKEKEDLMNYLNEKYLVYHNVVFLQGLFLACKAPNLYDICLEYAKTRETKMMFFEKRILEKDHTKVIYVINCPNVSSYKRSELEKLRVMLATLLHAQYDDVLVSGVKEGCVIVTFMIRNCLIPTLKTLYMSEKQSMTCQWMLKLPLKFKIMRVLIQDDVVHMSDLLSTVDELRAEAGLCRNTKHLPLEPSADEFETQIGDLIEHQNLEITKGIENNEIGNFYDEETNQKDDSQKLIDFLGKSLSSMTDDTLKFIKTDLKDFMNEETVNKMDTSTVLNEMLDILKLQYNFDHLEWIFNTCGEKDLLHKCEKFSSENTPDLKSFQADITPGRGYQTLDFHIGVHELETYNAEMQNMKYWLAETISVHPGKILMKALQTRPIVVTYMMKKKHCCAFLKFLETDDGQIAASRKRVEKITNNGRVIKSAKALNGSRFVHVRLRYEKSQHKGLKERISNAASLIGRTLGVKIEGNECYLRTNASYNLGDDNKGESKTFIEKNRTSLLQNLEPYALLTNPRIAAILGEENISTIKRIDSRQEKAKYFLNICEMLPKAEFEIVLPHLEESVSTSKTIPSGTEFNNVRTWIEQNRETILDEIDSDIIETTMNNMEDVSDEVKASWSDGYKGRREKARIFLDFVLQKDDYVKALQKTMEENGKHFDND